jgi:transposase InsO family protein
MARVLGVSSAGYYAWRSCARSIADDALLKRVRTIHAVSRGTYGAPRVHAELRGEGQAAGKKRIARLMRTAGIAVLHRHGVAVIDGLLGRRHDHFDPRRHVLRQREAELVVDQRGHAHERPVIADHLQDGTEEVPSHLRILRGRDTILQDPLFQVGQPPHASDSPLPGCRLRRRSA